MITTMNPKVLTISTLSLVLTVVSSADTTCSICLEELVPGSPEHGGVCTLPCNHRCHVDELKDVLKTNPHPESAFTDDNLRQFAAMYGANIHDVNRFAYAVFQCIDGSGTTYTNDELTRLAVRMAPRYGINARNVEHYFQRAMVNPDPRCPMCRAQFRPEHVRPDDAPVAAAPIPAGRTSRLDQRNAPEHPAITKRPGVTDSGFDQDEIQRAILQSMRDQERNVTDSGFDQAHLDRAMQLSMQDQRRFSEAELVRFANLTGANLSSVKSFANAIEERMSEGCTDDDELLRFAMFLAPAYGINDRYIEYAFQLTLANRLNRNHDAFVSQTERESERMEYVGYGY